MRWVIAASVGAWCAATDLLRAWPFIYPTSDGTLVDGGEFGPFDGNADAWDWTFNESSYEGAIALHRPPGSIPFERRVVFEFNLASVTFTHPVTARLWFLLRGTTVFPAPNTRVNIYSYPANLQEQPTDFAVGPTTLIASIVVAPFQESTLYTRDVSRLVNETLNGGGHTIGLRFQVDPATTDVSVQAFMDALDSNPDSKPVLLIEDLVPGDDDGDDDVDLIDYASFASCMFGPQNPASDNCRVFDFDVDGDVDLRDELTFEYYFAFTAP